MSLFPWLPVHPDLPSALRAAKAIDSAEARLREAIALAGFRRDAIATGRIDRLVAQADKGPLREAGLAPFRLAMVGSHTIDHLVPSIRVAGLTRGLAIDVHVGEYGMYREALLGHDQELEDFRPQAVLLCLDAAALVPRVPVSAGEAEVAERVDEALAMLRQLWMSARERLGCMLVQQSVPSQQPRLAGANEWLLPASPSSICDRLNEGLRRAAREGEVLMVDLETIAAGSGGIALYDPARWHQAKQLVNPLVVPLHGDHVARLLAAMQGKSRRCLVLDLDNTLWGGTIGDCGVEGIALGQGHATGEAFLAIQHYAAMVRERGIVLAVCSKNDHEVAKSAFDRHPEMRISFDDVACFVANWCDKATNLRAIAATLNLGLDALVFVDDNPAERAIVRRELPMVAVPELPDDVSLYPQVIAAAGYFEAVTLTGEDFIRARDYAASRQRAAALDAVTDMEGFLSSLDMCLTGGRITPMDRPRAAQLINKSNQYNLTTVRRSEGELAELMAQPGVIALAFRLRDKFGDSGLISVVIARPDPELGERELLIDTWLMSCRVLGRGVELAALEVLCDAAMAEGATALVGRFVPSDRNGMVRNHYYKLGFTSSLDVAGPPGVLSWRLELPQPAIAAHHLALEITA